MARIALYRNLLIAHGLFVVVSLLASCKIFYELNIRKFILPQAGYILEVSKGTSLARIGYILERDGVIPSSKVLRILSFMRGDSHKIKAGDYRLTGKYTASHLLHDLVVNNEAQYAFTIKPGWRFEDLVNAIRDEPKIKHTLKDLSQDGIIQKLSLKNGVDGVFFPDTYFYTRDTKDTDILKRAKKNMQRFLKEAWSKRNSNLAIDSPYSALIMASIIEKESSVKEEYQMIAGVYHRRLEKNMRLQADPTVIYAIYKEPKLQKKFKGRVYQKHLKYSSPYNTYRDKGLPPNPIAIPS